jgi:cell division protein FtsB
MPFARRWLMRLSLSALGAGALAYVPYKVWRSEGYVQYRSMEDQLAELDRGADLLREQNRLMRREIHRLRTDLEAVGAVARDELGMVKPGEIVIQIERSDPRP